MSFAKKLICSFLLLGVMGFCTLIGYIIGHSVGFKQATEYDRSLYFSQRCQKP